LCCTQFAWAAQNGHEKGVRILLGREEVNSSSLDNNGRTLLLPAVIYGHDGVVKLLLGREEVNPDRLDDGGQTALSLAAWNGHTGW